jgi:hypothetical protein
MPASSKIRFGVSSSSSLNRSGAIANKRFMQVSYPGFVHKRIDGCGRGWPPGAPGPSGIDYVRATLIPPFGNKIIIIVILLKCKPRGAPDTPGSAGDPTINQ